jgi:hypothetical protein
MGAERLIIDGKARTGSASRDGTGFSAVAPREACLAQRQRSGTTKKDLLRSKPQNQSMRRQLGNTATFSLSLHPAGRAIASPILVA